ncbi:sodium/potassium/calcium exchanger 1-like, partial [Vigna umbellata]|uniref:sodium/potassium/calcium exchanger 1-like n=1 Tax=Vigna umbellata TaxID=87088 RepID=UPI001F5F1483
MDEYHTGNFENDEGWEVEVDGEKGVEEGCKVEGDGHVEVAKELEEGDGRQDCNGDVPREMKEHVSGIGAEELEQGDGDGDDEVAREMEEDEDEDVGEEVESECESMSEESLVDVTVECDIGTCTRKVTEEPYSPTENDEGWEVEVDGEKGVEEGCKVEGDGHVEVAKELEEGDGRQDCNGDVPREMKEHVSGIGAEELEQGDGDGDDEVAREMEEDEDEDVGEEVESECESMSEESLVDVTVECDIGTCTRKVTEEPYSPT